jgi:uncharacterized membrane protein YbhN (UPF0104 family)
MSDFERLTKVPMHINLRKRHLALLLGPLAVLAALVLMPQLGDRISAGVDGVGDASPGWLWIAAAGFAASLVAGACGWASALGRCAGETSPADATARFCTGSLVNALAPARLGTAVRFALFARVLPGEGRLWTVGGIATSLSAVRGLWLALVLALGSASGALPRWPILALLGAVLAAAVFAWCIRDTKPKPGTKWQHAFDVFRVLGRCPWAAARIIGWVGLSMALRLGAAAGIAAAFGIERPLEAALLIIPALDLAGLLPLTPGNVGVSSAAVAFALAAHGAPSNLAVSAGIAFGAVETLTTLGMGAAGLLYFAGRQADVPRWRTTAIAAMGCLGLAAAFGATVIVPLV